MESSPKPRRSWSIRARLALLALAGVLPLVVFATILSMSAIERERTTVRGQAHDRAASLLAAVDRQVAATQTSLELLAASPALTSGDLESFHRLATSARAILGAFGIVVVDRTGQQIVSTVHPFGAPLPKRTELETQNRVFATAKPQISDLVLSAAQRRPILSVEVPVITPPGSDRSSGGGEVAYVLATGLTPDNLSAVLRDQNIPAAWTAAVFDRKGIILARNRELERFLGKPAAPILRREMAKADEGWISSVTSEGEEVYATFLRSSLTGWTVAVGVPRSVVDAPIRRALWLVVGGGSALLLLGLIGASLASRSIALPVRSLAAPALALGRGETPGRPLPGVREVEEVGEALRTAADLLARRLAEREAAEAAHRESEARYRTLIDALPQLVWTCTADGACDYVSRQWLDFTGREEEAQLGYGWVEVVHPDDRASLLETWRRAVETLAPYDAEARIRAADGSYRWFKQRAVPLVAPQPDGTRVEKWFGTSTDITDVVAAREALTRNQERLEALVAERTRALKAEMAERRRAEATLLQAQKVEAIGQLTGGVAHDFNNLLTAVMGNLEIIRRKLAAGGGSSGSDPAGIERLLDSAYRAAGRGAALTQQLLAFARKQHLQPRATDLNEIVAEMDGMLRRTLGSDIRISASLAEGLWPALVDPNQVEAAILNLAVNARDALQEAATRMGRTGGTLSIATANIAAGDPRRPRSLPATASAVDLVAVSVSDTGIGMDGDILARAFDPFFTTKEIGKGSGLGLSQVHGLAQQSGGTVEIRSRPGEGTTVTLFLPRAHATDARDAEPAVMASGPTGLSYDASADDGPAPDVPDARRDALARVLVVDDDDDVRDLIASSLETAGYAVVHASSGNAGLEAIERSGRFALAVVDFAMAGGMNGVAFIRSAQEKQPDLLVLLVTGYAEIEPHDLTGRIPVLKKPFRIGDLVSTVGAILRTASNTVVAAGPSDGNVATLWPPTGHP
jgi:PAS domain S-box-containing protein